MKLFKLGSTTLTLLITVACTLHGTVSVASTMSATDMPRRPMTGRDCPGPDTLFIDPLASDAQVGAGCTFRTVAEAMHKAERLQASTAYTEERPLVIAIAPAVYWLDDPDDPAVRRPSPGHHEPFALEAHLSHLRLVGLGETPEDVVWAVNRGQTQGAEGNFTMLHLIGDDIGAENMTFGNYCNVDLVYPRDPSQNRARRRGAIVQAQLIIMEGDKAVARHCRFISRLNLCPFEGARRALFDHCYMECTNDALTGSGVYLHCTFTFYAAVPFYCTEGTGAVLLDCDIHSKVSGRQYLSKMGSPISLVDCRWTADDPELTLHSSLFCSDDLRSYQHNVSLGGQPLRMDADRPWLTVDMTGKDVLRAYKNADGSYNIYNLLCGDDGWNPLGLADLPPADHRIASALVLNTRQATIESGVDTLVLGGQLRLPTSREGYRSDALPYPKVRWTVTDADKPYIVLRPQADGSCLIWGTNEEETPHTVNVLALTDCGLEAACVVEVRPRTLPSPAFVSRPRLSRQGDVLTVNYSLDLDGRADQSLITWYRCSSRQGEGAVAVAVSRGGVPKTTYRLTEADHGVYIMASVAPCHLRSLPGASESDVTRKPIKGLAPMDSLSTDFHDLPTDLQPLVRPGYWTMDTHKPADTSDYVWDPDTTTTGSWRYGRGISGASRALGLLQARRGARLRYTPIDRPYKAMSVELCVDPSKTAGQGFGSATGQYMDIFIKMDNESMTGYALRIIRTPHHDGAVDFLLVKYEGGEVTPVSAAVSSACYRTSCIISLRMSSGRLTAHAASDARLPGALPTDVSREVNLQAEVAPNTFGGLGLQHTGTIGGGGGASMIQWMHVKWEF